MRAEAVKFAEGSDTRLRILAVPYGGPEELDGRDLDGEYFSGKTDLCLDWYPASRPLLYHHGLHPDTDAAPVGKVDSTTATVEDAVGVWVEAELDKQARYYEHIRRLVEQKKLYASSGAMPHLVRKAKDGHIDRWPWVELSLTPTPANPLALVEAKAARDHYAAAGITPPPTLNPNDGAAAGYLDTLDRLTDEVAEVVDLTRRLTAGRAKVGRPQMTASRRERLAGLIAQMQALLDETQPRSPADQADADPADAAPDQAPEPQAEAVEGGEGAGKAEDAPEHGDQGAAHAPAGDPDLAQILAKFRTDERFYEPILAPARGRR